MSEKQFTIFDFIEPRSEENNKSIVLDDEKEAVPFNVEDKVMIDWESVKDKNDVETYYYLKDFKVERGFIIEVIEKPKLQYKVHFGDKIAYIYHDELELIPRD